MHRLWIYGLAVVINLAEWFLLYLAAYGAPLRGCDGPCDHYAFSMWWIFIFSPAAVALLAIIAVTIKADSRLARRLMVVGFVVALAVVVVAGSNPHLVQSLEGR